MKKVLLAAAIGLTSLTGTSSVMAAGTAFPAQKIANTKVNELSFKDVMRALYSGQMTDVYVNDEEIESSPYIGLGHEEDGEQTVAVMHPVISYPSSQGEPHYLVVIEKLKVTANSGNLVSCHACGADADLYSFKRLNNGQYQLVSQSAPDLEWPSSWGRIQYDADEIKVAIEPLGKQVVGSIFQTGYGSTGTFESQWHVLQLPENDFINVYDLGDAGGSNGGYYEETSPLSYSYESTYQVMPGDSTYFPIKLTYSGDKPTDDYEQIKTINYSEIKRFNPSNKRYQ